MIPPRRHWIFYLALLVTVALCAGVYFLTPLQETLSPREIHAIRKWVASHEILAPALFILFYIVGVVFCLPATVLCVVGGMVFNVVPATLYVMIGANVGALITFFLARFLGRNVVETYLTGPVGNRLDRHISKHGFYVVAWLRLMPFLPYNLMNYAFGLTNLRVGQLGVGNLVGMFPWLFVLVSLGRVTTKISFADPKVWLQPDVWGPFACVILLLIVPPVIHHYKKWIHALPD